MASSEALDLSPARALEVLQKCIGGHMLTMKEEDITIGKLSGGFSSSLYTVGKKSDEESACKVIVRLFSDQLFAAGESPFMVLDLDSQYRVAHAHGALGYGPRMFGTFDGGRVEEFIPSRCLVASDLQRADLRQQLARKLALFHHLDVEITDKRLDKYQVTMRFMEQFDKPDGRAHHEDMIAKSETPVRSFMEWDWRATADWLARVGKRIVSPEVLSQNDMQFNNCLVRIKPDSRDEQVTLIDYELTSRNCRGIDIGGHFMMWMIDVNSADNLSGIGYPDESIRIEFIKAYLDEAQKLVKDREWQPDGVDSIEHVLHEADYYALVNTFYACGFVLEPFKKNILASPAVMKKFYPMATLHKWIDEYRLQFEKRCAYLFTDN